MINIREYAHPMDLKLMEKIGGTGEKSSLMDTILKNELDQVCDYVLENSCVRLPEDSPLYQYLEEGQRLFGGEPVRAVYLKRDYGFDVECRGYSHPALIVPASLAKCGDPQIQRARMLGAAASAAIGHHQIEFLVWVLESMGESIPIPLVGEIFKGTLYEWYRCRHYSIDRAVYLATGDLELSLRNILFGHIPERMLKNFTFGTGEDTFSSQIQELEAMGSVSRAASKIIAVVERENRLPKRYSELVRFAHER